MYVARTSSNLCLKHSSLRQPFLFDITLAIGNTNMSMIGMAEVQVAAGASGISGSNHNPPCGARARHWRGRAIRLWCADRVPTPRGVGRDRTPFSLCSLELRVLWTQGEGSGLPPPAAPPARALFASGPPEFFSAWISRGSR